MGAIYWLYRFWYEIKKRTIIIKWQFPTRQKQISLLTKQNWISSTPVFFFHSRNSIHIPQNKTAQLSAAAKDIFSGKIRFFNGEQIQLPANYNWLSDPKSGYTFSKDTHWSKIGDFTKGTDIKYVWEKSRFCYLYTIVRYDYHFEMDSSAFVLNEINSWIGHAPVNCGPNYISSQEIAIRLLNWIWFLNYYKDADALTPATFDKIIHSIHAQAIHIHKNLKFSQILVRNNHILTEAAALYLIAILFPSFPESKQWKVKGREIFEKEINRQIFDDGSYLQYSMNYNRVVVQLLSWVIQLSKLNNEKLADCVFQKAKKTLDFLYNCMHHQTGQLPNYGANDGSLFFPLNNEGYSDYRPQLQALNEILGHDLNFEKTFEDTLWYHDQHNNIDSGKILQQPTVMEFSDGGYYTIRDEDTFTFIRCGNHRHRPSQADNLHIDIWYQDQNLMRDAGTYQYNCEKEFIDFYFGTASHNTVSIGDFDQMQKGSRFIWYYWSSAENAKLTETEHTIEFSGTILAFRQTGNWVRHDRRVIKQKKSLSWEIIDTITGQHHLPVTQIWNPSVYFYDHFNIHAYDEHGKLIEPGYQTGFFSETYGVKSETKQILFKTDGRSVRTIINRQH